jgi:hypothetical protein
MPGHEGAHFVLVLMHMCTLPCESVDAAQVSRDSMLQAFVRRQHRMLVDADAKNKLVGKWLEG